MKALKDMIDAIENTVKEKLPLLYDMAYDYEISLLKYSENVTFLVEEPSLQRKRVFRINRPDYHNKEELYGEIQWMCELKEQTDLILPEVYTGKNGAYIQEIEVDLVSYTAIMISFLEGKLVGELYGDELNRQMFKIGKILAKMHIQSQNRNHNCKIYRLSWDIEDILGEHGNWGNWRDFNTFYKMSNHQYYVMEITEEKIKEQLKRYGKTPDKFGLIHADLHCSNIIVKDGTSQIFDFDDCGYGYYLYDFGCTLVEYIYPMHLLKYMVEGYETVRKLTVEEKKMLDMFIIMRRIVRLAWIAGHRDNDTVQKINSKYYEETFLMAEEWYSRNE